VITGIGRTDIGILRTKNQDTILVKNEKIGSLENLFIVADGMGGHRAGEVASEKAVDAFCEFVETNTVNAASQEDNWLEELLRDGVTAANAQVFDLQAENPAWRGMGTTFSACAIHGDVLYYAHVGDSRIYTVTKDAIKQVSSDHSLVAELLRLGRITEEEARFHPNKNVMTRALGTEADLLVDTGNAVLAGDTVVLLCSDGLSNMVTDAEIMEILNKDISADAKADALIELANKNGGKDNISLIIINNDGENK